MNIETSTTDPVVVAFYYPQFHQDPLNDQLYGQAFTEWNNVARGEPFFAGHRQPRRPAAPLSTYDLTDPAIYPQQVELAKQAGVAGFCFYHYWMTGGRRILGQPFESVLASDEDFPFCLMWANHDWTMAWRGAPTELSLEMTYAIQDPADFIADIADALRDPRYIRIDDRPVLSIYEIDGPPDLSDLVQSLRRAAAKQGLGELFIAGIQSRLQSPNRLCPDLDALVEFPPHGYRATAETSAPADADRADAAQFFDYRTMVASSLLGTNLEPGVPYFRTVTPDWDNTARRLENRNPAIFLNSTPARFGAWTQGLLAQAAANDLSLPIVFINAWNEWGESAYLEPDTDLGSAYSDALATATSEWRQATPSTEVARELLAHAPERLAALFPPTRAIPREVDEAPSGPPATVWLDSLQAATAPLEPTVLVRQGPADIRGFVVNPAVDTDLRTTPTHLIYLVGDAHTYEVEVPAIDRTDLLSKHESWLSASNLAAAGFRGSIDFSNIATGAYELRVPLGDRVGVAKSTIRVVNSPVNAPGPTFNPARAAAPKRTMFEPAMSYAASLRPGSAHALIADALVERGAQRVLDCGCADGSFGGFLIERGIETHGLEFDRVALASAKQRLKSANAADLELPSWTERAVGQFDALLFVDILEHVRRPDRLIEEARSLLRDGGAIVTSIPNIAHISRRLGLLRGDWSYEDWGLLDRTHLRFFTLDSATRMFEEAGYAIGRVEYTVAPPGLVPDVPPEIEEFLGAAADSAEASAYQFIITAVPNSG